MKPRVQLLLLLAVAVCLRLPFLNQAFQLDDHYYLAAARYVQTDPLHPANTHFVFLGETVSMRGHPHPPFDSWFLGLAVKLTGGESEVPLHAIYTLFTLLSVAGMYALARRFTTQPFLATLIFLSTPAFVVHGNGLESDLPLLALWMIAAAAFIYALDRGKRWLLLLALVSLALATLAAYQAVVLGVILALYAWMRKRSWKAAVAACAVPLAVAASYQLFEALAGGGLPAAELLGNLQRGNYQSLANKYLNALALTGHLGRIVCPLVAVVAFGASRSRLWVAVAAAAALGYLVDGSPLFWAHFAVGVTILLVCATGLRGPDGDEVFLRAWLLVFFCSALAIFFAGAVRYLLPVAPAVALLTARALQQRPRWLAAAVVLQLPVSLALAASHYEQSNAYRTFMREMAPQIASHRTYINGEWGFQDYGQKLGAQPLLRDTVLKPGDLLLTSALGFPIPVHLEGATRNPIRTVPVVPAVPFRVIAQGAHSAFCSIAFGVRPFDLSSSPSDTLTAEEIVPREPTLSYLPMSAKEADDQIVSGIYALEDGRWRWMSGRAVLQLKRFAGPAVFELALFIPPQSPARKVTVAVNGSLVLEGTFPGPGAYTITSGRLPEFSGAVSVTMTTDKTFSAPGDSRSLGVILNAAGFKPAQ